MQDIVNVSVELFMAWVFDQVFFWLLDVHWNSQTVSMIIGADFSVLSSDASPSSFSFFFPPAFSMPSYENYWDGIHNNY